MISLFLNEPEYIVNNLNLNNDRTAQITNTVEKTHNKTEFTVWSNFNKLFEITWVTYVNVLYCRHPPFFSDVLYAVIINNEILQ